MTANSSANRAGKATMTDAPEKPGATASTEFDPYARDRQLQITEADEKLLSQPPASLKVIVPVEITEPLMTEVEFVARRIIEKVFQNDPSKQNLVEHIAAVAVKANAEYFEMYVTTHLWPEDGYGIKRT